MTDHDTTALTARLHRLADDMTPPVDVVTQVRGARAEHRRRRRGRITLVAVTAATAAVVVGTTAAATLVSADSAGQVAGPGGTTTQAPASPSRERDQAEASRAAESARQAAALPPGWQSRTFRGVTFAVPPGARSADVENDVPISSWTDGPSHIWNGPYLGGDAYSSVSVTITEPFEGGLPPRGGGREFTVPGAEKAYGNIEQAHTTDGAQQPDRTVVWLEMLDGDRVVTLDAAFAGGPDGEQMAHDLIATIDVS